MIPEIWTTEEVAKFLKVKPEELSEVIKENRIPHFRVGPHVRFRSDEIIQWTGGTHKFSQHLAESTKSAHRSGRNECRLSSDQKTLYIILNQPHTPTEFSLIPLTREIRWFFPGYKDDFTMETISGVIKTRVTSAPKGAHVGDPNSGNYIQVGLVEWFRRHRSDIESGDYCLRIKQMEKGKRYRLDLVPIDQAQIS